MKSVFFRHTGRQVSRAEARKLPPEQVARLNAGALEVFEADFLEDTRGRSLFINGDLQSGPACGREFLNAAGDSADAAMGYQIAIDTLTYISRQISAQKFYEIAPADYLPVMVGEGAFASELLFNRTYDASDDFETGIVRQGTSDSRLATATASIDGVTQPTSFWAKSCDYNLIETEQALRANSWDPVSARMRSRKRNWDLGIQLTTFLGLASDPTNFPGLLTQTGPTTDTAIITKYISSMTATELATFLAAFMAKYFTNAAYTARPDTFVMPYVDWLACSQVMTPNVIGASVGNYPIPLLDYLQSAFQKASQNPGFRILPLAYADKATNNTLRAINKNIYTLLRRDPESVRMNIPVNLTVLQSGTWNNFNFQNVAFGQFTGVVVLRNLEIVYFTF